MNITAIILVLNILIIVNALWLIKSKPMALKQFIFRYFINMWLFCTGMYIVVHYDYYMYVGMYEFTSVTLGPMIIQIFAQAIFTRRIKIAVKRQEVTKCLKDIL